MRTSGRRCSAGIGGSGPDGSWSKARGAASVDGRSWSRSTPCPRLPFEMAVVGSPPAGRRGGRPGVPFPRHGLPLRILSEQRPDSPHAVRRSRRLFLARAERGADIRISRRGVESAQNPRREGKNPRIRQRCAGRRVDGRRVPAGPGGTGQLPRHARGVQGI